jgi:hypothetical protein
MLRFSVESSAATCPVRYSYPDPADSFCSVIVTPLKAARSARVARGIPGWKRCVTKGGK